jgi:hypothetical protein
MEKAEEIKKNSMMEELKSIEGIEIFGVGDWNGDTYTTDDLDKIVTAFSKTKNALKPFVKLGHSENQELLKADELPAAGWISNVYRVGSKILADIVDMPSKIYELVKRKAYNRISSELFVNIPIEGETYPLALKGIALLGGETPAVNNLADIVSLYGNEWQTRKIEMFKFDATKFYVLEEQTMIDELNKKIASLEDEVKTYKEKSDLANAELKKLAIENRIKEVEGIVAEFISKEKILPVQGAIVKEILLSFQKVEPEKKFAINSKELSTMDELVKEFIEAGGVKLNTGDPASAKVESPKDEDFRSEVKKYAKEKNVTVREAVLAIWRKYGDEEK